jgi:hypothetical protein
MRFRYTLELFQPVVGDEIRQGEGYPVEDFGVFPRKPRTQGIRRPELYTRGISLRLKKTLGTILVAAEQNDVSESGCAAH